MLKRYYKDTTKILQPNDSSLRKRAFYLKTLYNPNKQGSTVFFTRNLSEAHNILSCMRNGNTA